ncbi:MAG: aspartyl/glutamyl-tRNA(Asn/Gln) amidotransferase C subunit [bacterium]|jgi:aspartyl/glutamyl-tRNA(Asn/Gln) amidotransferase C subunit
MIILQFLKCQIDKKILLDLQTKKRITLQINSLNKNNMSDTINVHKIAKLARLHLNEEEVKQYEETFQDIIKYIDKISEVEVDSAMDEKDESMQVIYHADKSRSSEVHPDQFSTNIENQFFKVPRVME